MTMDWLRLVHGQTLEKNRTTENFRPGDEIRVWYRIVEQEKERLGQFEGTVIRCRGSQASRTFTVRRVTFGEGVERVFPIDSKIISKIEVLRRGQVKRSRLYFLREIIGKAKIASAGLQGQGKPAGSVSVADAGKEPSTSERVEPAVAAAGKTSETPKPQS